MWTLLQRPHDLQAAAQRFIYDLESSTCYSACDETPAHKVWYWLDKGAAWPTYDDYLAVGGRPVDVLARRWQKPASWAAGIEADYEAGSPDTYTPAAWAAWLRMPEAVYRTLVDLVLEGRSAVLGALADGTAKTIEASDRRAVDAQVEPVLALARALPLVQQLEVIKRLTASMQGQMLAVAEEYAARSMPSQG